MKSKVLSPKSKVPAPAARARSRRLALALVCLLLALGIRSAEGVATKKWVTDSESSFRKGKIERLMVSSKDALHRGYDAKRFKTESQQVWDSLIDEKGGILLATGSPAGLARVRGEIVQPLFAVEGAMALMNLIRDKSGDIFASSFPDGKVWRITIQADKDAKNGKGEKAEGKEIAKLPDPYIWDMVQGADGSLYAAAGVEGKGEGRIYRIQPDGKVETWYKSEEAHLLSLAVAPDGALLAGGGETGFIYRIEQKDKARIIYDFSEEEVRTLVCEGGTLWVGLNATKSERGGRSEGPSRPPVIVSEGGSPGAVIIRAAGVGTEAKRGEGGGTPAGAAVYRMDLKDQRVELLRRFPGETLQDLRIGKDRIAYVAGGTSGKVHAIASPDLAFQMFDLEEKQILHIGLEKGVLRIVGTAQPGAAYLVEPEKAKTGLFTSDVFDASFLSRWGHLAMEGEGAVVFKSRSGNTPKPDKTWADWAEVKALPAGAKPKEETGDWLGAISSPPGRYIQVQAELQASPEPVLKSLTVYLLNQNQKPRIDSVSVSGGDGGDGPRPSPGPSIVVMKGAEGGKPDSGPSSAAAATSAPSSHSTNRKIRWSVSDDDSDPLEFWVFYRGEGEKAWIALTETKKPLTDTDLSLDTEGVPDGRYRVLVRASDKKGNPPDDSFTVEKESEPFLVDNGRPEILDLAYDAKTRKVAGRARDAWSFISSLTFAVDGNVWKPAAPKDGLFDSRDEAFEISLPDDIAPGPHAVAVKAVDAEGNTAAARIVADVKAPAGK